MSKSGILDEIDEGEQVLVSRPTDANLIAELPLTMGSLVWISLRSTPQEIETALRNHGIDPERVVVIPVGMTDPAFHGSVTVYPAVRPSNLRQLGIQLSTALEAAEPPIWIIIEDLIILLMYCGDDRVVRFLQAVRNRVRSRPARAVYAIDRETITEQTFGKLREGCDHQRELIPD